MNSTLANIIPTTIAPTPTTFHTIKLAPAFISPTPPTKIALTPTSSIITSTTKHSSF